MFLKWQACKLQSCELTDWEVECWRCDQTISLVRRDEQIEELKALGADVVINYTSDDVAKRVKEVTGGKMAHGGIDAVSGDVTQVSSLTPL